jgi:hypothetical protein
MLLFLYYEKMARANVISELYTFLERLNGMIRQHVAPLHPKRALSPSVDYLSIRRRGFLRVITVCAGSTFH